MATHVDSARDILPPGLLRARATVVLVTTLATVILLASVVLAVLGDHEFRYYTADPARTLSASPLVGLMSHAGVLLQWGAAAISVFAALLVARACGWRHSMPLLAFGLGIGYLAVDDLLLFHEDIYPRLGVPEEVVLFGYVVAGLVFIWSYRVFFRQNEWPLLAFAVALLGTAFTLDFDDNASFRLAPSGVEDSVKLFGLAFLAAYLVRLSARMLADAYPLVRGAELEPPDLER
jgi:hypothetical protein